MQTEVANRAVSLLAVRRALGPTFAAESATLLFRMNLTGTFQVYAVPRHGGWPDLLTEGEDRVTRVLAAPVGRWVVFARDHDGDERDALWAMVDDGSRLHPLTDPDSEAICRLGGFRHDGLAIAYTANRRHPADFDVYIQAVEPGAEPVQVWEGEGDWCVEGFYPQDEALLLSRRRSTWEVDLYRLALDGSRELTWLTPHEGAARFVRPVFGFRRIYCLTDFEREYLGVAAVDPAGEGLEWIADPPYDIDLLAGSPDGQRLCWAVNRDGYSEVYLYDVATRRPVLVEGFGPGVVTDLVFSPDGLWVAAEFQAPNYNPNIWVFSAERGFAQPVTRAPWCGVDPDQLVVPSLHRARARDGVTVPFWVYLPPASEGPAPVVVSLHGGPEAQERPLFSPLYQMLLAAGWAVVAPNVRGSTGYGKTYAARDDRERRLDVLEDIAAVVAWIQARPDLDAGRLAVFGASYGGYLALWALIRYPEWFRAGIEMVGMADLEAFLERTSPWRRAWREAEYGSLCHDRALLRTLSPIHQID
ncbi:MAG: alpha/beta fold hydrolase, partial [Firmicutes bacterium]|nr:S9 family peptidase [Alicyclobacillaceae bacterium]MCL6498098.1 alpha/beta fold hydrolase [Bacillota bacterium]